MVSDKLLEHAYRCVGIGHPVAVGIYYQLELGTVGIVERDDNRSEAGFQGDIIVKVV